MLEEETGVFNWPLSQLGLKDPNVWEPTPANTRIGGKNRDRINPIKLVAREKMEALSMGESCILEGFDIKEIKKMINNHNMHQFRTRVGDDRVRISFRYNKETQTATLTRVKNKEDF